jgi:predicted nucleic acid-binding protein
LIAVLYILDTDMVIFMLRGLKAPARQRARRDKALALVARCREAQANGDVIGLSAITVSELEFGAYNSGNYDAEIAAVRKILTPFEVLDYDGAICPAHYGRVRHELEQAGQTIGARARPGCCGTGFRPMMAITARLSKPSAICRFSCLNEGLSLTGCEYLADILWLAMVQE